MKITNKYGLPSAFLEYANSDKYSKGKADISVTSLIDSPRVRLMKDIYNDVSEQDVSDMIWALFGTAVHKVLEEVEQDENRITEERLYTEVDGWILSGAIDQQIIDGNDVSIIDYKTTSAWSVIYGKKDWELQTNLYSYLVQKEKGLNVKSIQICAILRDWNRRDAMTKDNYPKSQVVMIDIPIWSFDKIDEYAKERIGVHQNATQLFDLENELPLCSDEDKWTKPTVYAVHKENKKGEISKKALRLFDSYTLAENFMVSEFCYGEKVVIVERKGEDTRCKSYCNVSEFCDQFNPSLKIEN